MRWPSAVEPGRRCSVPITSADFFPTLAEISAAQVSATLEIEGVSFNSLLQGENQLDREAIYWHYPHYGNQGGTPGSSVRAGDHKLIEFFEESNLELYNLREDIGETENLAEKEPEITVRLHRMLQRWRESVEAKFPEINPDFVPWQ